MQQRVRIIGGEFRRRQLDFSGLTGIRPTPDRVRETLFNWLGQDLTGKRCLDAFAGSGALGFEAASRGAKEVLMLEQNPTIVKRLRAHQIMLGAHSVEIQVADSWQFLLRNEREFDVVFCDPPYQDVDSSRLFSCVRRSVAADGLLYVECGEMLDESSLVSAWTVWRSGRAGAAHYYLLRRR